MRLTVTPTNTTHRPTQHSLSIYLPLSSSLSLFVSLSFSFFLLFSLTVCLCLSACLSDCLSLCLSLSVPVFLPLYISYLLPLPLCIYIRLLYLSFYVYIILCLSLTQSHNISLSRSPSLYQLINPSVYLAICISPDAYSHSHRSVLRVRSRSALEESACPAVRTESSRALCPCVQSPVGAGNGQQTSCHTSA